MECPVCGRTFDAAVISQHVNDCLGDGQQDEKKKPKRKHGEWDFLSQPSSSSQLQSAGAKNGQVSKKAKLSKKGKQAKSFPSCSSAADSSKGRQLSVTKASEADDSSSSDIEYVGEVSLSTPNEILVSPGLKDSCSNSCVKPPMTLKSGFGISTISNNSSKALSAQTKIKSNAPLAERVRPSEIKDYIGQISVVGKKSLLHSILEQGSNIPSMILWGPPGCGKTTLAKIIAKKCREQSSTKFVSMSATSASVNDVKEAAKVAKNDLRMLRRRTILFLDEVHRFNKLQQDVLLPHVEDGTLTLIGATTENPSFHVNGALLSRCRLVTLDKLTLEDIKVILRRALSRLEVQEIDGSDIPEETEAMESEGDHQKESPGPVFVEKDAIEVLAGLVDGDARTALNGLQLAVEGKQAGRREAGERIVVTMDDVKEGLQRSHILYDKTGEEHFNTVSALIKSMRGSDTNAALYWLARMLEGGENPMFIVRRLVVFASEDVGLADPNALTQAVSTYHACHFIGMPECAVNLSQCVVYLARAPKSVEVYTALIAARQCVKAGPLPPVPLHLRNPTNAAMKALGYGKGYKYPPSCPDNPAQEYLPPEMKGTNFFHYRS